MRTILFIAALLIAVSSRAADLPQMSYINENSLLENFPLGKATKEDVYEAYGPPKRQIKDLPFNGEAWSYSKGQDSKEFTFAFRGNIVHDVIVRYAVGGFLSEDRSARKMQGAK